MVDIAICAIYNGALAFLGTSGASGSLGSCCVRVDDPPSKTHRLAAIDATGLLC